jgi:hypothetical protein
MRNLAAVIVGALRAPHLRLTTPYLRLAGVFPILCRCRADAFESGPLATNLCAPGSPEAAGVTGYGRGSRTTERKKSSICRTAAMNWLTSTGLVTYALACSL